jgi:hypothetical protein
MLLVPLRNFIVLLLLVAYAPAVVAAEWKPVPGPLKTEWVTHVSPDQVHPEYPRPQMVREDWTNLNGLWQYALTGKDQRPTNYDGEILVPFPIESSLSGVMKRVGPDQALWYRREVELPKRLNREDRLLLHFGAVDWETSVFVNGEEVGSHRGGYDPFTFEITDQVKPGQATARIEVKVLDPTDAHWQPRGKQIRRPHGIWYTPTTGIWQTVWIEKVPASFVRSLDIVPDVDASSVHITANVAGDSKKFRVFISDGGKRIASAEGEAGKPVQVKLDSPKLWSPDSPHLYSVQVELLKGGVPNDRVGSYFGMRKIELGKDKEGITRLLLNGKPLFQYGPLDQGFWPDGLYTAPTDEALRYDLEVTKQLGFNMVRKHVKVEPARWYYHCDKLGLLVWQDMPSGDRYIGANDPDIERTKESAEQFEKEWASVINNFKHFPCIVMWVPFNEGWGQYDTARIAKLTKELDPTRLVNAVSGWADRGVGDVHDVHIYPGPGMSPPSEDRALVLGEYGGLGLPLEGHTWQGKDNWGYRSYKTKEELNDAYQTLVAKLRPMIGKGLSAAVYTQTTDVEIEVNGLMTYDRAVLKFDLKPTIAAHRKLYLPPPEQVTVLPTSQKEGAKWRYTFEKPADGWQAVGFDDSSWREGPAGFGEKSTPGSAVRTDWKTPDIWLRREFELKESDLSGLALLVHHDEDTEVFVNGKQVAKLTGYTVDYVVVPLSEAAAGAFGAKNTIALHTHQTGGGQYIDVGLVRLIEKGQK